MPSVSQSYEVILDFTNDTLDSATVQLLRDYGRPTNRIILLNPGETMSLVLDAGDTYRYTLKTKSKVVNITSVDNTSSDQLKRMSLTCFVFPNITSAHEPGETSCAVCHSYSCRVHLLGLRSICPLGRERL